MSIRLLPRAPPTTAIVDPSGDQVAPPLATRGAVVAGSEQHRGGGDSDEPHAAEGTPNL